MYLTLHPDNTAELMSPVMEMGQFMRTTGPMILADEMDLDWSLVTITRDAPVRMIRNAKGELAYQYGQASAGGSQTVRNNWDPMRRAGATVRRMLTGRSSRPMAGPGGHADHPQQLCHRPGGRPPHQLWRARRQGGAAPGEP